MNRAIIFFLLSNLVLMACATEKGRTAIELKTSSFAIDITNEGAISAFTNLQTNKNYIAEDSLTYLMSLRIKNEVIVPIVAQADNNTIVLQYDNGVKAKIRVEEKETYLTFELLELTNKDSVDLILWGPYYTTIDSIIGETVGIVRDADAAIGIQSLNIKTLGGYPWNESDRMPAFDIFREEDTNNMHPGSDGSVLYRVEAAKPTKSGSSLQAYCRNRNKERIISDFRHDKIVVPPYADGGVIGSKIALFGSSMQEALAVVGEIEIAEGLPHPVIDGQWGKTAPGAAAAYIITDFTEDNIEQAIELTKKAGLKYLYHYGKTFENWGHFDLFKEEFPNEIAGLKKCIEKAEAEGVMVGTHFLSNFITTNDPYVTPIPDKRLAKVGSSVITKDIKSTDTKIEIESPDFFNQMKNNTLKTVQIGDELIRYDRVSKEAPWTLIHCRRGAFETQATDHQAGTKISKLLDHAYKVFLTETELTIEMSERMADIYNQTGLRQISFDGLEGNRSTGLGTYGESLMPYTWYNSLNEDLKKHLIIDASRTTHFFWHIYSRMNWGEPWYGGFRESQTEYRFNNQVYFKRNYMPGMLGWFKMTPETSIEDMEWLLARSAGYDAGYAFVVKLASIEKNGQSDKILSLMGDWEKLRLAKVFSEEQKETFRQSDNEFSLQRIEENEWDLLHINKEVYHHEAMDKQPGEPLHSVFKFNNLGEEQALGFILTSMAEEVSEIVLEINNHTEIQLPIVLKKGEMIKYMGGKKAAVFNANWELINEFSLDPSNLRVNKGENSISFNSHFSKKSTEPKVKLEIRTIEKMERVKL